MSTHFETVLFHKQPLYLVKYEEQPFVPMKPVVEGMGLSWSTQYQKIAKCGTKFNYVDIDIVASDGKKRQMACIPLKKLNGWLFSINPEKVKPELRETISLYQEECFQALYNYWHKGAAIKPKTLPQVQPEEIENFESIMAKFTKAIKTDYVMVKEVDVEHILRIARAFCDEAKYAARLATVVEQISDRLENQSGRIFNYQKLIPKKIQGE
jgi:hypothetical protein